MAVLNHLANETSPYLLQHAMNPVEWYPWCNTAFNRAKAENKPVLLSIGYSACHWCHVMARESFEDSATAQIMNDLFINIKVDREERPDIDQVYMTFVQALSGRGGWPLTVFLTPEKEPYYGGTYFPPQDRYGQPAFAKILRTVADFYIHRNAELQENLVKIREVYKRTKQWESGKKLPPPETITNAANQLSRYYEPEYGGIGSAPKFPAAQVFSLFLRLYKKSGESRYLAMTVHTLRKMAEGGIYDQLGGGFSRYSVDNRWLAPHFEKMLYDNALLTCVYLDCFLINRDEFFLGIARDILNYVRTEMLSPEGGFYSSLDADSEHHEGLYYLWDYSDLKRLSGDLTDMVCDYWGITLQGNFEHKNILHIRMTVPDLARKYKLSAEQVTCLINQIRATMLLERNKRPRPARDEKIIAAWNGLMLSAFARVYQVTRNEEYARIIRSNIWFIKSRMFSNRQLNHSWKDNQVSVPAFLDDYAMLIQGLLDSYEALFEPDWLEWAIQLCDLVGDKFRDPQGAGYFFTASDQEIAYQRLKDDKDNSTPSGTGIMALNLLRLYYLTGKSEWRTAAEEILIANYSGMAENPYGYISHLTALEFYHEKPMEIMVICPEYHAENEFVIAIFSRYIPNKTIVLESPQLSAGCIIESGWLLNRPAVDSQTTVYLCHDSACSLPVTCLDELMESLK
jgi:uncharacterized protein YyaL (SSP411 family)